ncbi:unnamed protein product [Rotaria socialis]|uniref:Phospholipid/glycerol acyltransferase domain-containing protein n=1 Tax=Rotaria socialis TaxID=392032 RepID=A0A818ADY7_9BILA|nr:unnamed protein product [Rotaria socialis]CAF3332995.1 unnamed protein product [Rotaria socialis]CAF3334341.1 unnamed protein product [Rotaria socialis]CAF3402692.1 unnamed protein product [Rotaria socialis]CAF3453525.1 unnamed protein product [Rotaria socialis]
MCSIINSIKVLIFYLILAISAFFGLVFAQTPAVPFIFLNRRLYFRWCSFAMGYYLLMATCLLEDLLGIKIVITGDDLTKDNKRSLIVLNHRTRLDWMFIFMLHSRFQTLKQLKIVLKADLKRIPGPGWAMQHAGYLFLDRIWEKDQETMKNISGYYKSCQSPLSILIFPEGTNLTEQTKIKSNEYAAKQTSFNGSYEYCLHPRLNGFKFLLNSMRSNEILDAIDDVTIGYEGAIPEAEIDLLKGHIPSIIHFHVKRYELDTLPQTDEGIGEWLQSRWEQKEKHLKEFYNKNQFDSSSKHCNDAHTESNISFQRRLAFILWSLFILFWSYCILAYVKIKFFVFLVCIFHAIMDSFANGVIDFVCQLDANYRELNSIRTRPAIKQD